MNRTILFEPLPLSCGVTIKNRFFKSAMSEGLGTIDHRPSSFLAPLYRRWAEGGAGIIVTGNVMIDRTALGEPRNVVIEDARDMPLYEKWAEAGTQNGAQCWVQLNHPGKQSPIVLSKEPVAPSRIPFSGKTNRLFATPRALSSQEIHELIQRFGKSAHIVKQAGFTGVQMHAAHGYLMSQFLSPYHNQRTDEWGGSLHNRMRFLLEVYNEIRSQVGSSFPVAIKLNSADFQRGGFTEDESIEVIKELSKHKVDLIEISGGNYEKPMMMGTKVKESTKQREAYFLTFAEKVREIITTPLVVTGGFRSVEGMIQAVESKAADMIGMARPFVCTPNLPNNILRNEYTNRTLPQFKTRIKSLNQNAGFLEILWYEQQLKELAKGKEPKFHFNPYFFLLKTAVTQGIQVFQKRRSR